MDLLRHWLRQCVVGDELDDGTENDDRLQHVDGIYGMSASHDRKTALSTNMSS